MKEKNEMLIFFLLLFWFIQVPVWWPLPCRAIIYCRRLHMLPGDLLSQSSEEDSTKFLTIQCPWSSHLLNQLDPAHRGQFPAILTSRLALDKKVVTLMKPRTAGNSSSYLRQSLEEIHSELWGRRALQYLSDCELHKRGSRLVTTVTVYRPPPAYRPVPLAQWFEMVHGNEIVQHVQEMQGLITSTYGRILKLDSTKKISKKITKKLVGGIDGTAAWMDVKCRQRVWRNLKQRFDYRRGGWFERDVPRYYKKI